MMQTQALPLRTQYNEGGDMLLKYSEQRNSLQGPGGSESRRSPRGVSLSWGVITQKIFRGHDTCDLGQITAPH